MTVRKAVIPAAGLGTRFLPATKAQPKEMLPVVDKPGIQYIVEDAVRAGIEDILMVTSRGKGSIEDHFDRALELEHHLEAAGKPKSSRRCVPSARWRTCISCDRRSHWGSATRCRLLVRTSATSRLSSWSAMR